MVLVDTSVWINHFRTSDRHLEKLFFDGEVFCHPHIIGELACGNIKKQARNHIITSRTTSNTFRRIRRILVFY